MSVAYAKEREQFGQPIGRYQGLKHQLAHVALDVEPARALVWYAAYAWDAGLSDAPRAAAMAKAHLCDVYVRATRAAVAEIGRASCRERVCLYVLISVVAVSVKKKN